MPVAAARRLLAPRLEEGRRPAASGAEPAGAGVLHDVQLDAPPPPVLPAMPTGVGPLLRRATGSRPSRGSGEPGTAATEAAKSRGSGERGVRKRQGRRPRAPVEGDEAGGGGELHALAEEAGEASGERKRENGREEVKVEDINFGGFFCIYSCHVASCQEV